MEGLFFIGVSLVALLVFGVLALRFGVDSRGLDNDWSTPWMSRGR